MPVTMSFAGKNVIAFESRRAAEMAELIRRRGGVPFVAPSMRELPIEENEEAFRFAERLFAGGFDMTILLTGVGARLLNEVIESRYPGGRFIEALRKTAVVVRGPKPAAVCREWDVPVAALAREPNTWREVLAATEGRSERRIAVQEYGRSNPELLDALRARGAEVTPVRVYRWDMPQDTGPLEEAARRVAGGEADAVLFTTSVQVDHLLRAADRLGLRDRVVEGLRRTFVGSIGPTCSEALEEHGIHPSFEPSHPKMGLLVQEGSERA